MRLQLTRKNEVPPGGFRYLVPETGVLIQGPSFDDLKSEVKKHLKANARLIPIDLEEQIETWICEQMPAGICKRGLGETRAPSATVGFQQIIDGTSTLLDWFIKGRKRVEKEESERRIKICAACPFNQEIEGCTTCNLNRLHQIVNAIVGDGAIEGESHIKACAICGCSLRAKVRIPLDVLQAHIDSTVNSNFPDFCWVKR